MKAILVTTQHRGVFFGYVEDSADVTKTTLALKGARCAIRWNTTKGIAELAEDGPNPNSKIGATADIEALHDITGVWSVTEKAEKSWTTA